MHRAAFRSLYSSNNHPKTSSVAAVSPIVDDMDVFDGESLSAAEEGNDFDREINASLRHNFSNTTDTAIDMHEAAIALKIHDVPEDTEYQLQRKSASYSGDVGMLSRLGVGQFFGGDRGSNQEQNISADTSVGQKHTVLGQKHQWRKNRARRSRQTISPIDDETPSVYEGDVYNSGRGSVIPSSVSSYYESGFSSQSRSVTKSSEEGTLSLHSETSERDSDCSQGRNSSENTSEVEDDQRFVITRQKKSKYAAKLRVQGQKPLYLGRYTNEAAALAACENAYNVISTSHK